MAIDTIGDTGTDGSAWDAFVRVWQITASATGNLSSVGIDIQNAGSGNVRTAIYTDSAGAAGTLLGASADTVPSTGWNDLSVTGVSIVAGTPYWIGFQAANNTLHVYKTVATVASLYYFSQAYGAFPTTPAWTNQTNQPTI